LEREGELTSHRGEDYRFENVRLYSMREEELPLAPNASSARARRISSTEAMIEKVEA
jgi:hypothetical protein